jgi:hypothetical protein
MKSSLVLLSLVIAASIGACCHIPVEPNDGGGDPKPAGRTVLFDRIYRNQAWVYAYSGFYVDDAGRLYTFAWRNGLAKPDDSSRSELSAAELAALHQFEPVYVRTIGADTIARMRQLIAQAAEGPWSDTVMVAADMGGALYSAYRYDQASDRYHATGLRLDGDLRFSNRSDAGRTLSDWLETLQ